MFESEPRPTQSWCKWRKWPSKGTIYESITAGGVNAQTAQDVNKKEKSTLFIFTLHFHRKVTEDVWLNSTEETASKNLSRLQNVVTFSITNFFFFFWVNCWRLLLNLSLAEHEQKNADIERNAALSRRSLTVSIPSKGFGAVATSFVDWKQFTLHIVPSHTDSEKLRETRQNYSENDPFLNVG